MKLNLGCGNNKLIGFINVDKYGSPDIKVDLEKFPWIWKTNSIEEIHIIHVLEHLGKSTKQFKNIIQELYRISKPNCIIKIIVPHPRSDTFLNDPTHIRAITTETFAMLSKKMNTLYQERKWSTTPLAEYWDVDFEIIKSTLLLNKYWDTKYKTNQISTEELEFAAKTYNNVVDEIELILKVIK